MGSGDVELHSAAAAAVAGDRRRTDELIRRVWPILVRYCRARVGSRSGSWDYADAVARRAGMAMPREYGPRYATRPFREFVYAVADKELASVKPSKEGVMSGAALNGLPVNERIVPDPARHRGDVGGGDRHRDGVGRRAGASDAASGARAPQSAGCVGRGQPLFSSASMDLLNFSSTAAMVATSASSQPATTFARPSRLCSRSACSAARPAAVA